MNKTDFSSKIDTIVPTSEERNNAESILVFDKDYIFATLNPITVSKHSELLNKFLQNSDFKCQFANRYADIINTLLNIRFQGQLVFSSYFCSSFFSNPYRSILI